MHIFTLWLNSYNFVLHDLFINYKQFLIYYCLQDEKLELFKLTQALLNLVKVKKTVFL